MSNRNLKKSTSGKLNRAADLVDRDADENLDRSSVNRVGLTSLDGLVKPGRRSFEKAKPESDDEKKLGNEPLSPVPEVPLGKLSRLVLEAKNITSKLQSSFSTTRSGSKSASDLSSRTGRSTSVLPSNIPTFRPSNIPTIRSSSVPKKTTIPSASTSSPKRKVSRSLTPVSRKVPSRSITPSRIPTTIKKPEVVQRSLSLTPRPKPQSPVLNSAPVLVKPKVRSVSVTTSRPSSKPQTPPKLKEPARSVSVAPSRPSLSSKPQTPPKLKETVALAFGKPVATTRNVTPKRNTSPNVTRTIPKARSTSSIPSFSGASHTTGTLKSVKSSATVSDSTRSGRKLLKPSLQTANNHLDVSRNGKVSTNLFPSTMLYPHSIKPSVRKRSVSEGSSSSNQEEEEGKSLMITKEVNSLEKKNSARYDEILNVKDVKDTNWLLTLDDESNYSLILDNIFDSPPELFSPL